MLRNGLLRPVQLLQLYGDDVAAAVEHHRPQQHHRDHMFNRGGGGLHRDGQWRLSADHDQLCAAQRERVPDRHHHRQLPRNGSAGQTNCCSFTVTVVAIHWTQWVNAIPGVPGSAWGTNAIGVCVSYSGDVQSLSNNYPSWEPSTTFSGGTVPCPPPSNYGSVGLFGDNPGVNTIIFSKPVVDPVMAIWCLGSVDLTASFMFQTTNLIAIESGGPSAEFPFGTSITQIGNIIYGTEGNGTIQFHGTFTQISWTTPKCSCQPLTVMFTVGVFSTPPELWLERPDDHASQHHLPWIAGDD